MTRIRAALMTREYPPEIYGGAGVHVEYLARELGKRIDLDVHCFGKARSAPEVKGCYDAWERLAGPEPELAALRTMSTDLVMAHAARGAQIVHSHTWYANLAGHLAKLLYGIPHVMTTHSLEPLRPWKAEQLGGGYALSSFCEKTAVEAADAVIAVSSGMKKDILAAYPGVAAERVHVIYNGIDPAEYVRDMGTDVLAAHGIDPARPYVVFVGRITRQKGIVHLLRAAQHLDSSAQLVLCAGEPDTKEIGEEVAKLVAEVSAKRSGVTLIGRMLPRPQLMQILSHARVFACPSVYEPFGIVNLEAMACGTAVVASAVGGIPEVVDQGKTGYLVPFGGDGTARNEPRDPEQFAADFAEKLNLLIADPELARRMGEAGRERVIQHFSWSSIADQTVALYQALLAAREPKS
jgi:alpha-maltose-1-phosphate synthase